MSFSFSRASHVEEATYCQHSRCTTPTWAKHPTKTIMWSKVILFFFKRIFFASTSPHELFSCLIFLRFYHGKQENDVFIPGPNELTNDDQLFELMASFEVYCILGYHFCFPLILLMKYKQAAERGHDANIANPNMPSHDLLSALPEQCNPAKIRKIRTSICSFRPPPS